MLGAMETTSDILFSTDLALAHVTLNRPRALNALTLAMCTAMQERLDAWAADDRIHAVLIDAVPGRAFCSGGDIRAVSEWARTDDPRAMIFFRTEYKMNASIGRFAKPYVALIDGIAMGGGVGISIHGSHRVATENAVFAMPETSIGFFPDVGASYFLPRCPGAIGMFLGLTSARLTAADMLYAGIATHLVATNRIAEIAPRLAAGENVDAVLQSLQSDFGPSPLESARARIDRVFSAPSIEAICERLESEGGWGREVLEMLAARSPTSLKLTHRELRGALSRSLPECLAQELQLVARVLKGHDFHEGIRAAIVDKDNHPKWQPTRLSEISDEEIATFFLPHTLPEAV
jgi:enoyl-CoA hydratase